MFCWHPRIIGIHGIGKVVTYGVSKYFKQWASIEWKCVDYYGLKS